MHSVCKIIFEVTHMYLHRKLETEELIDLLAMHTNRITQLMIYGETYFGEYEVCKRTIELIQNEIFSRTRHYLKPACESGSFHNAPHQ